MISTNENSTIAWPGPARSEAAPRGTVQISLITASILGDYVQLIRIRWLTDRVSGSAPPVIDPVTI